MSSADELTEQLRSIAAAVSVEARLLVLVLALQKRIVARLTLGAVKG